MIRKSLLASLAVAFVALPGAAPAIDRAAIPASNSIEFDVYRGNSRFGSHILRFEEQGDQLRVVSDVDLRVRIGPITAFRYEHDSVEIYQDGELVSIEASTLKDGERLIVDIDRNGTQLVGRGTNAEGEPVDISHPLSLMPSSHWQGYSTGLSSVLNTETGEEMPVTVTELGTETLEINRQSVEARRVRLEGSLTLDLWYSAEGEWLRCQFSARGQDITYIRRNI
ncbi:DUF6134 family protein [Hyphobacterium sp.]|uniref:DUF6134 family protein n=1 Tax=Hyphobacterium sp. TaxID=2004662 RepID=UPI003BAB0755